MADGSSVSHIKKSRKESNLHRIISDLFMKIRLEDKRLQDIFINRVQLSNDKSKLLVLFYAQGGIESFKQALEILKLYKPSMRKAIADSTRARYVPDIRFAYDAQFEKQQQLEELLDEVGHELGDE
jgi:ribosome-binding factor A